ncbi:MAG: demethoxyubiquinone hydroxylase family protein, partial [Acidobacteriota bacterium]|nr:demethoxyubiquinone hydroxylase family protein [Acidobacteriota bacterium]
MNEDDSSQNLTTRLQVAYSGERAAGYAYRGHWHSVANEEERVRIKQIEDEEWHHRELVGEMLRRLDAHPSSLREIRALIIGRVLGVLCHFTGWLAPM